MRYYRTEQEWYLYSFSYNNYWAGLCGSGHNLTGDIPQGNATYDAATANIGSPWKMPTSDQLQELFNGTTSEWTTFNGVNGRRFTNKTDYTKYIFLPAGGKYANTTNSSISLDGYYLSTKWHSTNWTYAMHFYKDDKPYIDTEPIEYGLSVRAILKIPFKVLL